MNWIFLFSAGFLFLVALLLLGLERGDKVGEVAFQRHRLNTNNGRRRRLLFDLDVCWLRDAQSLPYRAGARVALAGDDVALPLPVSAVDYCWLAIRKGF